MGRIDVQNLETRFEFKFCLTLTVTLGKLGDFFEFQFPLLCNDKTYSQVYCQDDLGNVCKTAL